MVKATEGMEEVMWLPIMGSLPEVMTMPHRSELYEQRAPQEQAC